jgi:hypothetical protein
MNIQKKRGWIFGGAAALFMAGTLAQLSTSRAQNDAGTAPTEVAATATNLAPAELPKLPADLTPGLADVIKLTQSNVGDDVVLGYIKNSGNAYKPTADEILYLNDLGVSQNVINALMQNGKPGGQEAVAATASMQQQIPTPPSNAQLSSPEVPSYSVTQDASVGATVPPPDVPAPASVTVSEQTPPPEVTVNYFYDQLSPYGSWVEVEGYGRCWRPSVAVVNTGWRPYCDNGYWVNTDSGWYWRSYYSWGWAPFHYGRWCSTPRFGWCWIPDCTWGPAWVAWREHDRYCGWAALPPYAAWRPGVGIVWTGGHGRGHVEWGFGLSVGAFTFVGYDHFTDRHPWRHQPAHNEVVNIYNHSTVINNTIIVNNKTTIINNGISKDKITQVTHKPVQTYALKDTTTVSAHGKIENVGNKPALAVYRPSASVIARTAATPAVHKPVLINNSTRTASISSTQTHSTFGGNTRTPVTHTTEQSRFNSPKASGPSASRDTRQTWPGENTGGSTGARANAATTRPVAPLTPNTTPRFEPNVHSTTPAFPNGTKTVEQSNNYGGSRAAVSTAPSASYNSHGSVAPATGAHAGAGVSPYSGGHAGGAPAGSYGGGHGAAASPRAFDNNPGKGH